ncbi:MAG: glycan-binding surface protein [Candidatus Symbiothrix sp.]|jgi:hypothetical protein|nr:glycan-binding surface protein [Candidatus Symbiothrix sp.]
MKNINYKKLGTLLFFFGLSVSALFFNACKDDSEENNTPVTITKVFLEDAQDKNKVFDRDLTPYGNFVRLGQTIRLEGRGFVGVTKVLVNGFECVFNPVFLSDNSMIVQISSKVPTLDVPDDIRNTICFVKGAQKYYFPLEIRAGKPSITDISHTMPAAGDEITITGTGLQLTDTITFPGDPQVVVTEGITSDDEDGKWVKVIVPAGVNKSGSIFVKCANGGAYSPANFNFKEGLLHNFDDVQNYAWGSGVDNTPLTATIPANAKPASQGGYQVFNAEGNLAGNTDQRFWLNSNAVMDKLTALFPGSTLTDQCGVQMDIYVEGEWNSGVIRMVMADGWGNSRYCMLYEPVYVGGKYDKAAFVNPGAWFTITLPFSLSEDFADKSVADVIAQMAAATYKQAGPWFDNVGITGVFDAIPATEKVYFDNIRVVSLATAPAFSDFPDEE